MSNIMPVTISRLADVHPRAILGDDVEIGPFCLVGPHVTIGDGCRLDSHVSITGHTTIGERNRFFPGCVIGGEPQDISFSGAPTQVVIGDENQFREGVTVNRGAEKEDHVTRIGHRNFLMANSHVAHNCHVYNNSILCNGVLLGGHVHVQDFAIISGNSVVHHFATIGTLAFVSGGCRAPQDVPPFMLAAGSDNPEIVTVNVIGMKRRGIADSTIHTIRRAHRLLFRDHLKLDEIRQTFLNDLDGVLPLELVNLLNFIEQQYKGKNGRGREAVRLKEAAKATEEGQRRAA
jgi:UDP-N-acetylglucosamine acyltransferase